MNSSWFSLSIEPPVGLDNPFRPFGRFVIVPASDCPAAADYTVAAGSSAEHERAGPCEVTWTPNGVGVPTGFWFRGGLEALPCKACFQAIFYVLFARRVTRMNQNR